MASDSAAETYPALRLVGVEVRRLGLSLVRPVGTSAGTHHDRPVVLVRVVTDVGEGWGEAGALAEGTAVDPSTDEVWAALAGDLDRLMVAVIARDGQLPEPSVVARVMGDDPAHRMAGAAIEMAVLDALLQASGRPLVDWLGGRSAEVASGAVVGIPPDGDPDRVIEAVTAATAEGYTRIRLKIGPGFDRVPVAAVRQAFPALHLQADANGAYRLDAPDHPGDARRLADLDEFGLACLEQPLPPADLAAHAALAEHLATPIALDESLTTPRRVSEALRYRACRVACLKPARLGGLAATLRSVEACRAAGIDAFVGGFFETGLGRSANAALASHPGFTLPGDLSSPAGYLVADPFSYPKVVDGRVAVPSGPGVAPAPDSDLLERHTVEVLWTAAPGR